MKIIFQILWYVDTTLLLPKNEIMYIVSHFEKLFHYANEIPAKTLDYNFDEERNAAYGML